MASQNDTERKSPARAPAPPEKSAARKAQLAEALRRNLARRKQAGGPRTHSEE